MKPALLMPKVDTDTTKENHRPIFLMHIDTKVFNKIISKPHPAIH